MTKKTKSKRKRKQLKPTEITLPTDSQIKPPILPNNFEIAKNLTKRGWQIFGGIALIVGFVALFYPKISVYASSSLDPQSALLTPFVISNDGNIPINDVQYRLGVQEIRFTNGQKMIGQPNFTSSFSGPGNSVAKISPDEKFTILSPLQFNPSGIVAFADIAVIIDFNPAFLPFKMHKVFRFITSTGADGKLYWYAQPVSKTTTELSHLYTK